MALNYSHRPVFPAHVSEDNLVSPMKIVNGYHVEGTPDKIREGFTYPLHAWSEPDKWVEYGRERDDRCGLPESASKDIVDLLPSDPFEMGINTYPLKMTLRSTFTTLSGWFNDLEIDRGGFQKGIVGPIKEDYSSLTGWNLIWNGAMRFQQVPSNVQPHHKLNVYSSMTPSPNKAIGDALIPHFGTASACSTRDTVDFNNAYTNVSLERMEGEDLYCCSDDSQEALHDGLFYALSYLGVKDLLSVQMVCKSLYSAVKDDPLLWRSIHIDKPLNERITDDALRILSSRAHGNVHCLSLVECPLITDDGLRRVLEANPRVKKLCVPGCTRLSIEGILNILKVFNSKQGSCIKQLRVGGLYGVTHEIYEGLKSLLDVESFKQQSDHKPQFYMKGSYYLCDDDRPIDVEVCPMCDKMRLVYDCPSEGCQVKDHESQGCRACTFCIERCVQCGKCFNDRPYEETFCLDCLCNDCRDWIDSQEEGVGWHKHPRPYDRGPNCCLRC